MSNASNLIEFGRLPEAHDNVAIAVRRLEAGTRITHGGRTFALSHTVLEGHRFAVAPIAAGASLLSWHLPFGRALRDIAPGDYVINARIIAALQSRHVEFPLPAEPNFENQFAKVELDEAMFRPGQQVPPHGEQRYFQGYTRGGNRGIGTRNCIVVLGTSSLTASFARTLAAKFKDVHLQFANIDAVAPVAHTEGGGAHQPHNFDFIVRTLAGFMVNPNVGAVLAVDFGTEPINNRVLQDYLAKHHYPLDHVLHRFMSVQGKLQDALAQGEAIIRGWLEPVNACQRMPQPVSGIKIGLQCGGSDAFSGISGNPLVGWLTRELVRYGGSANLAETDELIGAEPYILANMRDYATARAFLDKLARFQERASWHGTNAEGNPSGGNMFRGLYNIALKSIGAARKKDPATRIDYVIDYSQRMLEAGFYFMDSPGNDLESIAGQVGAGCNLIVFTTGNGSITNFPFVPTIKVMTNSGRFELLSHEMDFNAGRYLAGESMDSLGAELFDYMQRIVSGEPSAGEKAGHSQVQLWREWPQTDASALERIAQMAEPDGEPLKIRTEAANVLSAAVKANAKFKVFETPQGPALDQIGLILPTSLCSGQIGKMIADKLNQEAAGQAGISRYLALPHTEGCGVSGGRSEEVYMRAFAGYMAHPHARRVLLLEHGCERTHNDAFRNYLAEHDVDASRFGFASVQLDGGIENVTNKVMRWFHDSPAAPAPMKEAGLESLRLGLVVGGTAPDAVAHAFAIIAAAIVQARGTTVIPHKSSLLQSAAFTTALLASPGHLEPTISYGQIFTKPGLHLMEAHTDHQVEALTGLGATGVELVMAYVSGPPLQGHPMIPLIQVCSQSAGKFSTPDVEDMDLVLDAQASAEQLAAELLKLITRVAGREYTPKLAALGNTDFQVTRGLLGLSL